MQERERRALVVMYETMDGKHWKDKSYWLTDRPLNQWKCVKEVAGYVVAIRLHDNLLKGNVPSIGVGLERLVELTLSWNKLEGPVPWRSVYRLRHLKIIDFSSNKLTGEIPWLDLFSNLPQLATINVGENFFETMVPSDILFRKPESLHFIDVRQNSIRGVIDADTIIFITYMRADVSRYFDLRGNDGPITLSCSDDVSLLVDLDTISLSNCSISSSIPQALFALTNLIVLDISWNQLSGALPDAVGCMSSLECLDLSHNDLEGVIPDQISRLTALKILNLSSNPRICGEVPMGLAHLWDLEQLDISSTGLAGDIPRVGHLMHLHEACFTSTRMDGPQFKLLDELGLEEYMRVKQAHWLPRRSFVTFIHRSGLMSIDRCPKITHNPGMVATMQVLSMTVLCLRIAAFL
jgi:Leucine rich repeat